MRLLYDVVQGQCGDSVLCGAKVPTCASPRDKGWEDPLLGRRQQRKGANDKEATTETLLVGLACLLPPTIA